MKSLILTCLILCLSHTIHSCSCINPPRIFVKNVKADHIILAGVVLEHLTIPPDSSGLMIYHSITKLKVSKWYQNKIKSDTIYYANGMGSMCTNSIEGMKIGSHLIIKAKRVRLDTPSTYQKNKNLKSKQFFEKFSKAPIIGYGICDTSILSTDEKTVTGNITKNYSSRKWKKISMIRKINKKWGDSLRRKWINQEQAFQEIEIEKFNRLMERKRRDI